MAGRLTDARITGLDQGERLDRTPPEAGATDLVVRGYPQPDGLRRLREAGTDALVRATWNSLRLWDEQNQPIDWLDVFSKARARGAGSI